MNDDCSLYQKPSDSDKSEEVQAIIDRMPTQWAKYVAILIGLLIGIIILLGFIIKYPDTVDGQISITAHYAPVHLMANYTGRINLLKANNSLLNKGEVIAYIENGAIYAHILQLETILHIYNSNTLKSLKLPGNLILGEMSPVFNSFIIAHTLYVQLVTSNIYETMQLNLQKQIEADQQIVENVDKEISIKKRVLTLEQVQLQKDSILLSIKAMSEQDFQKEQSTYLSLEELFVSLHNDKWTKLSDISKNQLEIQRITLEESESKEKSYADLMTKKNELSNSVSNWKDHYMIISPMSGELEYLGFWKNNCFVQSGQELFSVIPGKNEIIGEVLIPSIGAGKVNVGQIANVKVNNYPFTEYGIIKGVVHTISRMTNNVQTKDGNQESYLVTIFFPSGMITNFGKKLPLDFESKGTIEIITKKKRLIERLFDNLKSKTEK